MKWYVLLAGPALAALMAWAIREAVANYLSGKGNLPMWGLVSILAVLGGLALVFLAAIPWAFRARVHLDGETLRFRGLFRSHRVTRDSMEGYRFIQGKLHLYLKHRQMPLDFSYFHGRSEIEAWVRRRARDLGEEELQSEARTIQGDPRLGFTGESQRARLKSLGRPIRLAGRMAWVAGLGAGINVLFFKEPFFALGSACLLIAIPLFLNLYALSHRGHVRVDHREGSLYPQIFSASLVCGAALGLISLLDRDILSLQPFLLWFVPALLVQGLVWILIDLESIRELRRKGFFVLGITLVSYFLLPSLWVGGSIYQINRISDSSPVSWHPTTVLEKQTTRGKTVRHLVKVKAWAKGMEDPLEISVSRGEYARVAVAEEAEVGVRQGALGIPWVTGVRRP